MLVSTNITSLAKLGECGLSQAESQKENVGAGIHAYIKTGTAA